MKSMANKIINNHNFDLIIFAGIITILNLHLAGLFSIHSVILLPETVKAGQLWRLITHPFIHVSWYHLFIDAGAFIFLYTSLQSKKLYKISQTLICGFISTLLTWFCSSNISQIGFCGLSGVAHGLMAVLSLEMIFYSKQKTTGIFCMAALVIKCSIELAGSSELLSFFHFGLCGTPLYESHAGGVAGGVVAFFIIHFAKLIKTNTQYPTLNIQHGTSDNQGR